MMKEIGGYFGLERFSGREYHHDLIGVNSGRNALAYILKAKQVQKLYIPAFLCDSVLKVCLREKCEYEFYGIDKNLRPVFDRELEPNHWIYVVNYYGQISNHQIIQMKSRWGNVIIDNVQAFFQKPVQGVDTVYSCRKFFGVPDGGYVATDAEWKEILPLDASRDRMKHILGRYEESGSAYYADFQSNDELFYDLPLRQMSELTRNILRAVDYEEVRYKRNENYVQLVQALGTCNMLKPTTPDGPYCYPFYCQNGMEVRRRLAQKKIYVATLWPSVLEQTGTLEADYASNILPLPCDQRYGKEDMQRLIEAIKAYIG